MMRRIWRRWTLGMAPQSTIIRPREICTHPQLSSHHTFGLVLDGKLHLAQLDEKKLHVRPPSLTDGAYRRADHHCRKFSMWAQEQACNPLLLPASYWVANRLEYRNLGHVRRRHVTWPTPKLLVANLISNTATSLTSTPKPRSSGPTCHQFSRRGSRRMSVSKSRTALSPGHSSQTRSTSSTCAS